MTKKMSKSLIKKRRNRMMLMMASIVILLLMLLVMITPVSDEFSRLERLRVTDEFHALQETQLAQGIETATPYIDDFQYTATALIGQLTEDALIIHVTQVAKGRMTNTPSPTPVFDEFYLTAKAFLGQGTVDAIAFQMTANSEPDDFSYTATALIGQLTQDVMMMTDVALGITTLTPTMTPRPMEEIKSQWLNQLENEVGFSHPEFDRAIDELTSRFADDLLFLNRQELLIQVHRYSDDIGSLVAVMLSFPLQDEKWFVFDITDDEPILLKQDTLAVGYWVLVDGSPFADYNLNGYVDFVFVEDAMRDDCLISKLNVLEFRPDGLVDISPELDEQPNMNHSDFVAMPHDKGDSLVIVDLRSQVFLKSVSEICPASQQDVIYKWNGERFAPVESVKADDVELDDAALTATALFAQLTVDANSIRMTQEAASTPYPTDSRNYFQQTATHLAEQQTKNALVLTDVAEGITTLTPSPTLLPFSSLEEQWLGKIEDKAGFTHPVFEDVVQRHLDNYGNALDKANEAFVYVEVYDSDDEAYLAITFHTYGLYGSNDSDLREQTLLIFKLKDGHPELLLNQPIGDGYIVHPMGESSEFADFNQNGLLNFAFVDTAECGTSKLVVLAFSGDKVQGISPLPDGQCDDMNLQYKLFDTDGDGLLEFVGFDDWDRWWIGGKQVQDGDVIYKWNGERYARVESE